MSKMVSRLVTGDEEETVVHFKPGSVACLERGENGGGWTVQWFLRPELLGEVPYRLFFFLNFLRPAPAPAL